jgi:hypothetical protein
MDVCIDDLEDGHSTSEGVVRGKHGSCLSWMWVRALLDDKALACLTEGYTTDGTVGCCNDGTRLDFCHATYST